MFPSKKELNERFEQLDEKYMFVEHGAIKQCVSYKTKRLLRELGINPMLRNSLIARHIGKGVIKFNV